MRGAVIWLGLLAVAPAPARAAAPLRAWPARVLRQDFAARRHTTIEQVLELRVYDLKQARGVIGFTLGRHRSPDGKWSYAGLVVYSRCGARTCAAAVGLPGAQRVRALQLVDLAARRTAIDVARGGWRSGTVVEPARPARRPLLVVQTEQTHEQDLRQEVALISLEQPAKPRRIGGFTSRAEDTGADDGRPGRGRGRGLGRGRPPRFSGHRVAGVVLYGGPGKPPRLELLEQPISTRFNRCKEPTPEPTVFVLQQGSFVRQPTKSLPGGCR